MQASMEALATMDESQLATIAAAAGVPVTDDGSADGAASAASSVAAALSSGGSTAASSGGSSSGSTSYSDMLSRVYSLLGSGYQWSGYNYTGDNTTSSFTCSGVVDYALGRDSQSSSPETLYEEVGSNITTDVNSLQAGDLVFYSYGDREVGHVGVYVGDGQVIDAIPNGGVAVRDVNYMDVVGGGSLSY
jgi:cell wall-associated NlpC family hydrolase